MKKFGVIYDEKIVVIVEAENSGDAMTAVLENDSYQWLGGVAFEIANVDTSGVEIIQG